MSEDRLEKALQAMKDEKATPEQLAEARERVWEKLDHPGTELCSEIRKQLRDYLDGRLAASRRLLVEDHLGRCPACRTRLAEEKGERNGVPMPARHSSWLPKWGIWAAAAAVLITVLFVTRDNLDSLLAPRGPRATVESLAGGIYLVQGGQLNTGSAIYENAAVRTGPGARARLRLHDGSSVDVNERTELSLHGAWSGQSIRLQSGDVIVHAAKQHRGHLRVETRDSVASVKGTIFAVSAGFNGTLVSVVEGSVAVSQQGSEALLLPGQQAASNPGMTSTVQEAIAWSPDAESYLQILASVSKIEKQMAVIPTPSLRAQSTLLPYIPAGTVVYGAVPNLSGTIDQAVSLAEQQSAENPAFYQWWNSGSGTELKKLIGRVQTVAPLLGEEIVYGLCVNRTETVQGIPILLAEVRAGKRAELEAALGSLGLQVNGPPVYRISETMLAASNSATNLQWLLNNMGQGTGTPFVDEIAARYRDGAGWLMGVDMDSLLSSSAAAQNPFVSGQQLKHLFIDQRKSQGTEENEVTLSFKGPRTGLTSMLASTGSGGAAEYLTGDSVIAVYMSTREPQQLFEELMGQFSKFSSTFRTNLAEAESKVGIDFSNDLAGAIGTESAFAIQGLSATGPVWTMAILVNDPARLDATILKLVNSINSALEKEGKAERFAVEQETVNGLAWKTLKFSQQPFAFTWTYDRGYMVAGSDRGVASQAIATRNGGSPLVWSADFKQQLPASAGLHPSGFAWLNTKGALSGLASMAPNPVLQKLFAERDPILVTFGGTMEQIRAVSRTRLSGMVVNLLMMQGMSGMRAASQTETSQQ